MNDHELLSTISRFRRTLFVGRAAKAFLAATIVGGALAGAAQAPGTGARLEWWAVAFVAAGVWMVLTVVSVRQVRTTHQAASLLAGGHSDLAERTLRRAVEQFTLYPAGKLLAFHNLAVMAHGRRRYAVAARMCDAMIHVRMGLSRGIQRVSRMLLADCLLFQGDVDGAMEAIRRVGADGPELSLDERLLLLPIRLKCEVSAGNLRPDVAELREHVRLAELLDAPRAALVHLVLARACRAQQLTETADFLERRAALYHDLREIEEQLSPIARSAGSAEAPGTAG